MSEAHTKSERTRRRILDAAARVFKDKGYSNTRLSDVAKQAEIQTGSLYYHFDSREALVDEILRVGLELTWQHVSHAVDALAADATPLKRLAAAIHAQTIVILQSSDYATAQTRIIGQVPPEVYKRHMAHQRKYGRYWTRLIEDAVASGELRDSGDVFITQMLAFGAMNWTAEWFRPGQGRKPEQIADLAVDMILYGLATEPRPED